MKNTQKTLLILLLLFTYSLYSQEDDKSQDPKKESEYIHLDNVVSFGRYLTKDINLSDESDFIVNIELKILPSKYSKDFYNSNNQLYYEKFLIPLKNKKISWMQDNLNKKKYSLIIPPLKPNKIYFIKVSSVSSTIYNVFNSIHNEGKYELTSDVSKKKGWMKLIDKLSDMKWPYDLSYNPSSRELKAFKDSINKINLTPLTSLDSISLRNHFFNIFQTANFNPPKFKDIYTFSNKIQSLDNILIKCDRTRCDQAIFSSYFSKYNYTDYINIYDFYDLFLRKEMLTNAKLKKQEFIDLVKTSINISKKWYEKEDFVPNFISTVNNTITEEHNPISSNSNSFTTSFKNILVPDFGYVFFVNTSSSSFNGGSPFVGVNISISPVNKDVPFHLSDLSLAQKLSIHTGVILESISEPNKRDDFFNGMSLMLGVGYKACSQSIRINIGGIFYKELNQITGQKSLAIQPYIGLSIDIEIRKWLSSLIPSFTNNLKS